MVEMGSINGAYRVHGTSKNVAFRNNEDGKIQFPGSFDVDGVTIDGHELDLGAEDVIGPLPTSDSSSLKNLHIENIHINRDKQILRLDDSNSTSNTYDNITLRNCTNIAGGVVSLVVVRGGGTLNWLTLSECYTNATEAVRAEDAMSSTVVLRDSNLQDTTPVTGSGTGSVSASVINNEAEESASAETPQQTYPEGTLVRFTDSGDGSGTETYLIDRSGSPVQISSYV